MKKNIQQGDLSFHLQDKLPEGLTEIKHNGIFQLAESETTGHIHRLKGDFKVYQDKQGRYYLAATEQTEIEHFNTHTQKQAEHNTHTFSNAPYLVRNERSYNPFKLEIEKTVD